MLNSQLSRRGVLITGAAALGAAVTPSSVRACSTRAAVAPGVGPSRSLRFAHMTDSHIQPELRAEAGVAACLRHVQDRADAPTLLITGGDLIMDSFAEGFDRTKAQWDLFNGTFKRECSLEVRHCIGNHDIWGWNKAKSKTAGNEQRWGKSWAAEALGMERPFYSFSKAGWHVVVLDSVRAFEDRYLGGLDDSQYEWLAADLSSNASLPTVVISHIPILSVVAMMADGKLENNTFTMSAASVFQDGARVHRLLRQHRQVKVCVSGHIHMNERVELDGLTYICDGAVSGAWWKGKKDRCGEGYGLFDLYEDGTFKHDYVEYGWDAKP